MSIEIIAEITGWEQLYARVDHLESASIDAAGLALVEFGKNIAEVIRDHYVPVYSGEQGTGVFGISPIHVRVDRVGGTLRESIGSSEVYTLENEGIEVLIWAGKPGSGAESYAAVQHENLLYRHKVGQAKYIEVPVMLMAPPEMAPYIASYVSRGMQDAWG